VVAHHKIAVKRDSQASAHDECCKDSRIAYCEVGTFWTTATCHRQCLGRHNRMRARNSPTLLRALPAAIGKRAQCTRSVRKGRSQRHLTDEGRHPSECGLPVSNCRTESQPISWTAGLPTPLPRAVDQRSEMRDVNDMLPGVAESAEKRLKHC
jgi:hypothetical protein